MSLLLSLASCTDFGAGEAEYELEEYFSSVCVLSDGGSEQYSFSHFNSDIDLGYSNIPAVVPYDEYCYIGFRVADGYTVKLSEFAFFARSASGSGSLELEFYVVEKMPTSIKGSDGSDVVISAQESEASSGTEISSEIVEDTETSVETAEYIREEDVFISDNNFYRSEFSISENWDSVLLQFSGEKTVRGGEYVVVRIKNNCYSASGSESYEPISFTFNYLLFYINSAHKS